MRTFAELRTHVSNMEARFNRMAAKGRSVPVGALRRLDEHKAKLAGHDEAIAAMTQLKAETKAEWIRLATEFPDHPSAINMEILRTAQDKFFDAEKSLEKLNS